MDNILSGIENVMCFIDDILVTGENEADHLKTLNLVLERLEKHRVKLNQSKCQFLKSQVSYLGHLVREFSQCMTR